MANGCQFWKDYDSIGGAVSYCELAAFNRPVNPDFLERIGCTVEKRKQCLGTMELNIGTGAVPAPKPMVPCDPPPEIAKTCVTAATKKAAIGPPALQVLALLAGAYIAMGAIMFTIITNDISPIVGDGLTRLIGGIAFSLGLILVILGGAELFTGNNLLVTGYLDKKVTLKQVLSNWGWVYSFNFIGSLLLAVLFFYSGIWKANGGAIGLRAINVAFAKSSLSWTEAIFRGILCNWLVCLAVWLSFASKDAIGKIIGIMIPIAAFVAAGFEHSVANMYFIPMGLFLKNQAMFEAVLSPAILEGLTLKTFFVNNLIPVTIGNLIGGVLFVGVFYWNAYLRPAAPRRMIVNGRV